MSIYLSIHGERREGEGRELPRIAWCREYLGSVAGL